MNLTGTVKYSNDHGTFTCTHMRICAHVYALLNNQTICTHSQTKSKADQITMNINMNMDPHVGLFATPLHTNIRTFTNKFTNACIDMFVYVHMCTYVYTHVSIYPFT